MAKAKHQGGRRKQPRRSTREEEKHEEPKETALEVKEEAKGTKQEQVTDLKDKCGHYTSRIAELMDILVTIELYSSGAKCQRCDLGKLCRPPKKKKDAAPNLAFLWACLDCQQIFCGKEIPDVDPEGHLTDHARNNDHPLYVRLDAMNEIWCIICLVKEEVESPTTIWDELEVDNSCIVKKLPNYGNTCYFNSFLQNLFAMDKLRESLVSLEQPVGDIARELKRLFTEAYDDSKDTIQPKSLLGFVCEKKQFAFGTQQDSHELLIFLVNELESEEEKFANKIFSGEASSSLHCAQCGCTWTMHEPFLDLSLAVPSTSLLIRRGGNAALKDNVSSARKGDIDKGKGSARRSLLDEFLGSQSSCSPPKGNEIVLPADPFGMDDIPTLVPLAYMMPGSSEPVPFSMENIPKVPLNNMEPDFSDPSYEDIPLAKLKEYLFGRKSGVSSSGKAAAKLKKEEANKSKMVSDEEDVNEDVNTDVEPGKWSGDSSNVSMFEEVYGVDNTNGPVSIERCLDIYTQAEELSDTSCDGCSGKLQQQQPSETSDFQEDGDKSRSEDTLDLPRKISDQNKVECAENNLSDGPRSSQTQTEADRNEDSENKCKQVKSKITKMLFINNPPPILTIHLKRFTKTFQKIEGHIDFKELLDLTPYISHSSVENKQYLYRLIGVVEHLGSTLCGGHYVAYVKREKIPGCKAWFKANDTQVEEIKLREVLKRDGYIFFYERIEN